ncbi:hypothetical protein T4D_12767 [Trichinella pseudospiralis]|uniref:Uncharacterized protein n=1 Tax=Trichinella pseudospiralis TaxID=6337 RepID=A0A0V1DPF7_TRIPS|nr:hypothetical protein T4D_12767 [Trichinella pseudospiralis]
MSSFYYSLALRAVGVSHMMGNFPMYAEGMPMMAKVESI